MQSFGDILSECLERGLGNPDKCAWTKKGFARGILSSPDMISRYVNDPRGPLPSHATMVEIKKRLLAYPEHLTKADAELIRALKAAWHHQRKHGAALPCDNHAAAQTNAPQSDVNAWLVAARHKISRLPQNGHVPTILSTAAIVVFAEGILEYLFGESASAHKDTVVASHTKEVQHSEATANTETESLSERKLIVGTDRNDVATAEARAGTFYLGPGDDIAFGGTEADVYVYDVGHGFDTIADQGLGDANPDVLVIRGVSADRITFRRDPGAAPEDTDADLLIEFDGLPGQVRVVNGLVEQIAVVEDKVPLEMPLNGANDLAADVFHLEIIIAGDIITTANSSPNDFISQYPVNWLDVDPSTDLAPGDGVQLAHLIAGPELLYTLVGIADGSMTAFEIV